MKDVCAPTRVCEAEDVGTEVLVVVHVHRDPRKNSDGKRLRGSHPTGPSRKTLGRRTSANVLSGYGSEECLE